MDTTLINAIIEMKRMWLSKMLQHKKDHVATALQYEALQYIKNHPQITMRECASHLFLSMSSATQLIERMVANTFVLRGNDPDDRRIVRLSITLSGEKELAQMRKEFEEKIQLILTKVSKEDLTQYIRIQKQILEILSQQESKC